MTLTAHALACDRNGRVVFSGLDFELHDGTASFLRGPNGAGKSTLLRVIAGLLPPSHGTLTLTGIEPESLAQQLHYIAHTDAMKAALTVSENLEFWCGMLGGRDISAALSAFALEPLRHESAAILSAGQRRRLALSRLFLAPRKLWLLDEPATALDRDTIAVLRTHIMTHLERGGMALIASHDDLLAIKAGTISISGARQ